MIGRPLAIQALKYGNRPHYAWTATPVAEGAGFVLCRGAAGRRLIHHTKGAVFTVDTCSIEFYSFAEWFTVCVDVDGSGARQYYCNIAQPARREGGVLSFVDLDLDLVWARGSGWRVVDEEEFEVNAARFAYPPDLVAGARAGLEELRARIDAGRFPFDGTLDPWVRELGDQARRGERPHPAAPAR